MLLSKEDYTKIASHQPLARADKSLMNAAVAIILRDGEMGTEFLMMQRAVHDDDPWAGQMSFPGGKIDEGDKSAKAAAIRETQEEVNIELNESEFIGQLNDLYGFRVGKDFNVKISAFVFKLNKDVTPVGNYEVADMLWIPLDFLNEVERRFDVHHPRALETTMQGVRLDESKDQILWGLSLRVLVFLFDLLQLPMNAMSDLDKMRKFNYME